MIDFLLLAFIFLAAGVIAVPIASKLKLGSVLGYLLAGIAISPLLAWLHVDVLSIQHFAEFGVVMMLFLVGLELEPKQLWALRNRLLGLGGLQVSITALLVMAIAMSLGQPWSVALAIGLVFSLSSTAIVLQTLNERGLAQSDGGRSGFSVLLFQDIAVIPMLALLPLLAMPELMAAGYVVAAGAGLSEANMHGESFSFVEGRPGWQVALITIAAVSAVIVAGSFLTRPIFRFIALARLRELFTATALTFVIGIALLMLIVGLSPALGTFIAGVILANSEYRHELESDIDPFRGLLLGLFFMTVGAGIDFQLLADNAVNILLLTLGLIVLKAMVLFCLAVVFKVRGSDRWLFALGLAQAGEFGFVLLSLTVGISVIPAAIADQLLLVVALSMLLTPGLFLLFDRVIAPRFVDLNKKEADKIETKCNVIIAGIGRVGGIIYRILGGCNIPATIIDYNAEHLENIRTFKVKAYYGDATRPDLLHAAGIEDARVFVIAIDDREQITKLVEYIHTNYPDVRIVARAVSRHHVYDLWAAGCRDIIRDTFDSSLRMGRSTLEAMGMTFERATEITKEFETADKRMLREAADVYRRDIPAHQNEAYVKKVIEMNIAWRSSLIGKDKSSTEKM